MPTPSLVKPAHKAVQAYYQTALVTQPACEELGLQQGQKVTALLKATAVCLFPRR
jgi:molybdopterin-binding protein